MYYLFDVSKQELSQTFLITEIGAGVVPIVTVVYLLQAWGNA